MSECVDLRPVTRSTDKGVVRRNRPVVPDTNNLADVRTRLLRLLSVIPVSTCDVQESRLVECDARAVAAVGRSLPATPLRRTSPAIVGLGNKDVLKVRYCRAAIPSRASHREGGFCRILLEAVGVGGWNTRWSGTRFGVGEVDEAVLREPRVKRDVHQPAQGDSTDLRHTADRCGIKHPLANHAQPPGTLCHEHVAIRKECESPRMIQSFRDDGDMHPVRTFSKVPRAIAKSSRASTAASAASTTTRCLSLPWRLAARCFAASACSRLPRRGLPCGRAALSG